MWTACTIITQTWLASVINFRCVTNLTLDVQLQVVVVFFILVPRPCPCQFVNYLHFFVKSKRWIPQDIISFVIWFSWRIFTPQNLAAAIIWFWRFNSEASRRRIDLYRLLFQKNQKNKINGNRGRGILTYTIISQL